MRGGAPFRLANPASYPAGLVREPLQDLVELLAVLLAKVNLIIPAIRLNARVRCSPSGISRES